jgi:hypothetical protein
MEEENDEPLDYFDTLGIEVRVGQSDGVPSFCCCSLASSLTLFSIIQRSYHLDIPTLKKAYKKLMKKLHPDLHRNQSEEEQDDIHDQASNVTRAYRTLLEPQHRALHLLELMGKPLDERTTVCTHRILVYFTWMPYITNITFLRVYCILTLLFLMHRLFSFFFV